MSHQVTEPFQHKGITPMNALYPMRIVGFSGNTHRPSKTQALVGSLLASVGQIIPVETQYYDVLDFGESLGTAFSRDQLSEQALAILQDLETADGLVLASPTYKGSYSGLFKHVVDLLAPDALINKPVIVGATGGGLRHALIVEHQLRPLMGFFNANTIATSVYASDGEFEQGIPHAEALKDRITMAAQGLAGILSNRSTGSGLVGNAAC
ncbi:NAD(P)H-dependent oxidoreductase [Arvimicrobium flavum]|uniref:NAD(P)H-dependent oxidoreductase n=1 Tax=Arvimicrobium flavum TaxID=3393320 RepID=UPI00237C288C|nr:NAD(P)H-dependent oxidoreductase [Mesorhizobium shangrilense]